MFQLDDANPSTDLLVKVRKTAVAAFARQAMAVAGSAEPVKILDVPARRPGLGIDAGEPASAWLRIGGSGPAWDRAHGPMVQGMAATGDLLAAEPDVAQRWLPDGPDPAQGQAFGANPRSDPNTPAPQDLHGGMATDLRTGFAWHLLEKFGGLGVARGQVSPAAQEKVLIVHLDTGYDPAHHTRPRNIQTALERNFTSEGSPTSAVDMTPTGGFMLNRGHGTGTIGLLAGGDVGVQDKFTGDLGGAPHARILPVRIADSVVRFTTSTMIQGIDWAIANGAHVLSMSMGGVASAALADAVNRAYDAGLLLVTAAGNNIRPSPASIVYPARFRRVVAATGVMADGCACAGLAHGTMQGNHMALIRRCRQRSRAGRPMYLGRGSAAAR